MVVAVKALACSLPYEHDRPLSRWSISEIRREAVGRGLVASIGETTVWRWLAEDAIRPWSFRTWIFPRDPRFEERAGPVLDLYQGLWQGQRLSDGDCILSTDEMTGLPARRRIHPPKPPAPGQAARIEHEYKRGGAWAYFAAWDVRRARVHGRCETKTGIAAFERFVEQVMAEEPYRSAPRVFWVMDNGSSHRGQPCLQRLAKRWPKIVAVHTPVHASWLNQVEVYFSIVRRKALTPDDFPSLAALQERLLKFQAHYGSVARPFEWKFTRADLAKLIHRLRDQPVPERQAA